MKSSSLFKTAINSSTHGSDVRRNGFRLALFMGNKTGGVREGRFFHRAFFHNPLKLGQSRCKCTYLHDVDGVKSNGKGLSLGENERHPVFQPRKAAILTKMTRYEYERRLCERMSDLDFRNYLDSKDSDYYGLLERHKNHYQALDVVRKELLKANIEVRVVSRFGLDQLVLDWADVVFTTGGDGTYLLAANKFMNTSKPLIGLNSDPNRSEGNLCLPKSDYSAVKFGDALKRLLAGEFDWKWLQRIKVTMSGKHSNDDPVELHDQTLIFPEHRFTEHIAEDEEVRILRPADKSEHLHPVRTLPCLALNEVFVGESLSSRVSYYEFSTDTLAKEKQKSSGVTICTGTGSSSWHFHINHLCLHSVKKILRIANDVSGCDYPHDDEVMMQKIRDTFNSSLRFDPSEHCMAYTIRDPIQNAVFSVNRTRGFAKKLTIRSRMWDACLVIDGGMSFKFNDGAVATFEIAENNALRTVTFN